MSTDNQRDVLWDDLEQNISNSKKIYYQLKSLQAHGNYNHFLIHFYKLLEHLKRASLRLSVGIKGSISVEASIAIPVFLLAFLEILSLFNYITVYSGVLRAMKTAGDAVCVYGYAYDLMTDEIEEVSLGEKVVSSVLFSQGYVEGRIRSQCQEIIYRDTIRNGLQGISLLGTYIDRERAEISITAHYTMVPVCSFAGTSFPVLCRYYGKWWTGYPLEEQGDLEEYVYITDTGSVYHISQSCTHLNLSVTSVARGTVGEKRNDSGERYRPCNLCSSAGYAGSIYYITDTGDKYHEELTCSGLKRTVYRIEKSEAEGWRMCSRCSRNLERQEEAA